MAQPTNKEKMLRGELYYAFTPELIRERQRCANACKRFNNAQEVSRRKLVGLWREKEAERSSSARILGDSRPLPPALLGQDDDDAEFDDDPWVEPPIKFDYGTHVRVGPGVYINSNCTILDTCLVTIGARTLIGPNVSFFSGTHPLDPSVRNGTKGPELGGEIHIGEDCWFGGNAIVLPGVTIGNGCTVGAGSVVTKDVPPFHVVAGNPARVIRKITTKMDPTQQTEPEGDECGVLTRGAEEPMTELAEKLEKGS